MYGLLERLFRDLDLLRLYDDDLDRLDLDLDLDLLEYRPFAVSFLCFEVDLDLDRFDFDLVEDLWRLRSGVRLLVVERLRRLLDAFFESRPPLLDVDERRPRFRESP